jgi:hypothetical protein
MSKSQYSDLSAQAKAFVASYNSSNPHNDKSQFDKLLCQMAAMKLDDKDIQPRHVVRKHEDILQYIEFSTANHKVWNHIF